MIKQWFRYWTVRLQSVALAITSWLTIDPVGLLAVVSMLPHDVRVVLPPSALLGLRVVGGVLMFLSLATKFARVMPEQVKRPVK